MNGLRIAAAAIKDDIRGIFKPHSQYRDHLCSELEGAADEIDRLRTELAAAQTEVVDVTARYTAAIARAEKAEATS